MVDLGKVVIFAGQPEDGRVGVACRGRLPGASHGGGGFERRKQRPAKQPDLLPGNHGSCAPARASRAARQSDRILLRQQSNQFRPMSGTLRGVRRCEPATPDGSEA